MKLSEVHFKTDSLYLKNIRNEKLHETFYNINRKPCTVSDYINRNFFSNQILCSLDFSLKASSDNLTFYKTFNFLFYTYISSNNKNFIDFFCKDDKLNL